MAGADILIKWTSESAAAVRDINRVNTALGRTSTTADKTKARLNQAAVVSKAVWAGLAVGAVYATKKAIAQQQAYKGLTTVYGKQTDAMKAWATQQAKVGLSATQAATAASKLGASLQGAGFSVKDSATQAQSLVSVATDLGAVFGDTEGAVTALGAAMRGEYDPLEQYGIALKQSDVSARLAAQGQDQLTGSKLKAAEAQARLDLIMEQAMRTQGAATDENKTAQQQMDILRASVENLAAQLGTALLPALQTAVGYFQNLADWMTQNQDTTKNLILALAGLTGAIIVTNAFVKAGAAVQKAWGLAVAGLSNPIGLTVAAILALAVAYTWVQRKAESSTGAMKVLWQTIGAAPRYINPVQAALNVLTGVMQKVLNYAFTVAKYISAMWDAFTRSSLAASATSALQGVANAINNIIGAIGRLLSSWSDLVGRIGQGLPSINLPFAAATAGVQPVTHSGAGTYAASPRGAARTSSAVVININGYGGDPDTLARRITSVMARADRRYNRTALAR